jgi:hypothetical protein
VGKFNLIAQIYFWLYSVFILTFFTFIHFILLLLKHLRDCIRSKETQYKFLFCYITLQYRVTVYGCFHRKVKSCTCNTACIALNSVCGDSSVVCMRNDACSCCITMRIAEWGSRLQSTTICALFRSCKRALVSCRPICMWRDELIFSMSVR